MSDKTPYDDVKAKAVANREQVIRMVEEHIGELELHLGEMPNPKDPVNSRVYIKWERVGMSWIGQVKGQLEMAQLFGWLTPEEYQRLKRRAMAAITNLMAKMVMSGGR